MNYKEKIDFINSLGWIETGFWANRTFYGIPYGSDEFGGLLEHNGDWFISNGNDTYCIENPSNEKIAEYTVLIKRLAEIMTNPDKHNVSELMDAKAALKDFFKRSKEEAKEKFETTIRDLFK